MPKNTQTHNPLIEPPKGSGRSRWRQTTRRWYVIECKRLGIEPTPATSQNKSYSTYNFPPNNTSLIICA